jgi:hypothetical protein
VHDRCQWCIEDAANFLLYHSACLLCSEFLSRFLGDVVSIRVGRPLLRCFLFLKYPFCLWVTSVASGAEWLLFVIFLGSRRRKRYMSALLGCFYSVLISGHRTRPSLFPFMFSIFVYPYHLVSCRWEEILTTGHVVRSGWLMKVGGMWSSFWGSHTKCSAIYRIYENISCSIYLLYSDLIFSLRIEFSKLLHCIILTLHRYSFPLSFSFVDNLITSISSSAFAGPRLFLCIICPS